MTRKLISILLILLIFSSAALADVPVLDLRAHDADARFPSDAAVLTVAFPQMTFADAAILVCDGHAGMIDAGGYAEESAVQTALEALGVTRLDWVVATHPHHDPDLNGGERARRVDWVVATHPHHDHQPGFEAIARRMPIGRFLTSFPANENAQMQHTLAVMADCGVPIENASDGQMLTLGHAQITLILPENTGKTINNRSLLALVTLGDARMLMLADLESMGQQALLDSGDDVHADILKYPHHGHAAMNQALLTTIAPKLAIITAKPTRAPYALAQLDAMAIPTAHTDECGLLLQTDGQVWILQNLTIEE